MEILGQQNTDWLSVAIFSDSFDWNKAIKTTFLEFFDFVTLHDSFWQTISLNVTNETILTIQLDVFWNKEYCQISENTNNWPFLVIKIPNVLNISYNTVDFATTIVGTSSTVIPINEVNNYLQNLSESRLFPKEFGERLRNCKQLHKTRFDDVYGGNIEILHESEILVLLIGQDRIYIDPSLDKVIPFDKQEATETNSKGKVTKFWNKLTRK